MPDSHQFTRRFRSAPRPGGLRHSLLVLLLLCWPVLAQASTTLFSGVVVSVNREGKFLTFTVRVTACLGSSGEIDVGSLKSSRWDDAAIFVLDGRRVSAEELLTVGQHVVCYPKDGSLFFGVTAERDCATGFVVSADAAARTLVLQAADADGATQFDLAIDPAAVFLLAGQPASLEVVRPNAAVLVSAARPLTIVVSSQPATLPALAKANQHSEGGLTAAAPLADPLSLRLQDGATRTYALGRTDCYLDARPVPREDFLSRAGERMAFGWCTRSRDYPNFLVAAAEPSSAVHGTIQATAADQLVVTSTTGPITITGLAQARILLDGQPATAASLTVGQQAWVLHPQPQILRITEAATEAADRDALTRVASDGAPEARGAAIRFLYRRGIPLDQALPILRSVAQSPEAQVVEGSLWTLTRYGVPQDPAQREQVVAILADLLTHGNIETITGRGYFVTGDLGQSVRYLNRLVDGLGPDVRPLAPAIKDLVGKLSGGRASDLNKSLGKAIGP